MLNIGRMLFTSEGEFEFNVSRYSTMALHKADHTNELEPDGRIHLRIDYKVSGIGSNSCGPALPARYQLNEKQIEFSFHCSRAALQNLGRETNIAIKHCCIDNRVKLLLYLY